MDKNSRRPTSEEYTYHKSQESHKKENPLRDVILGGQDGLVNALGIILGVTAATADTKILIGTVLAATFAESLSMGAVAYTSAISQKDHYEGERKKLLKDIDKSPIMEREEMRRVFEQKGFEGHVLEEIVTTMTQDKNQWADTLMSEELRLQAVNTREVLKSSVIVTIATMIGHLIPLLPFFVATHRSGLILSVAISGLTLFAVGVYQAVTSVGNWFKSGLRMVIIGLLAAFIGYFIAKLFNATGA